MSPAYLVRLESMDLTDRWASSDKPVLLAQWELQELLEQPAVREVRVEQEPQEELEALDPLVLRAYQEYKERRALQVLEQLALLERRALQEPQDLTVLMARQVLLDFLARLAQPESPAEPV